MIRRTFLGGLVAAGLGALGLTKVGSQEKKYQITKAGYGYPIKVERGPYQVLLANASGPLSPGDFVAINKNGRTVSRWTGSQPGPLGIVLEAAKPEQLVRVMVS